MKNLFLILILLTNSIQVFGQNKNELFKPNDIISEHSVEKKLKSMTEFQLQENGKWTKTMISRFDNKGLTTIIIGFDKGGNEIEKNVFRYDTILNLKKMEHYKDGKLFESKEYLVFPNGEITYQAEFVYSTYDGSKIDLWKTYYYYNTNKTLKETIKTMENDKDTTEIKYYDTLGIITKTIFKKATYRTTKIEYTWNEDKSEMKEMNYQNDTSVYYTVIHKFKDKKEYERIDPSSSQKPFYWIYDSNGRVIETNEAFFAIMYFTYDGSGMLESKIVNVLFSDSDEKDLPKKIKFRYEYEFYE